MSNNSSSKYTVNARILDLQSRVLALETENKTLRQWVLAELTTKINDLRHVLQDSIRVPADGRDGVDGATGLQGAKGERGDCLIPNESEMASALLSLRHQHARLLAKVLYEVEIKGGHHSGMRAKLNEVLQLIAETEQPK